ncbi:flagellar export chaperone FliS [Bacillus alkalicellulosilyticus]|uniref:flagellar export chaperone FliS n=1 Tax=Alkalihalobacterium alkalicellulosilyticum TaxID=1912214 RepID=UPI0009984A8D|nr:flagellar export chaperone FliS [Bacillus alkalicellulosilyticus]
MAMPNVQARAYQQNTVSTASPGELTLMLYNGCLKFIKQAKVEIGTKNIEAKNVNITKAQNIIRELMVTLKTETEMGKEMLRLYDFILNRLIDANINNDVKALNEAEEFVVNFRDTWKEVVKIDRQNRLGNAGGKA